MTAIVRAASGRTIAWLAIAISVFLLTPSASVAPLGSWPLTPAGCAALAVAIGVGVLAWKTRQHDDPVSVPVVALGVVLIGARLALSFTAGDTGWRGAYFANDAWSGQPEWSSDFRFGDATRIDRRLQFGAGEFPVHYLNGYRFVEGESREVSLPMSVEWRATFQSPAADTVTISVNAVGTAEVLVDEQPVLAASSAGQIEVPVAAGSHLVRVRYLKPAGTTGALQLTMRNQSGDVSVVPEGYPIADRSWIARAAFLVDWASIAMLAVGAAIALQRAWVSDARAQLLGASAVVTILGIQGYVTALGSLKFRTLTGGDDWFGFESRARDILQYGLLMPLGRAIGDGNPYFYHPFYSYFLAGVHALTGESLFGAIFAHFLILAVTALIIAGMVRRTFGRLAAIAAVVSLLVLFEIDFVRYYTTTLISENLYILTVTGCLAAFARWAQTGHARVLALAGLLGGLSAVTRPAMMVFFIPAVLVTIALARTRRIDRSWPAAVVVVAAAWLAVVLPFTARNWIVSRQAVLISAGQERAVVALNVPPSVEPRPYVALVESGQAGTIGALWRIASEHPREFVAFQIHKFGFTLGMVHWFKPYRPHPELVAVTVLYLAMLVVAKPMRSAELWPVHAFIASHWASMALTSPWNYGYRMILPAFLYMTPLSVAAACTLGFGTKGVRPA